MFSRPSGGRERLMERYARVSADRPAANRPAGFDGGHGPPAKTTVSRSTPDGACTRTKYGRSARDDDTAAGRLRRIAVEKHGPERVHERGAIVVDT